jgi:hypothetical protein
MSRVSVCLFMVHGVKAAYLYYSAWQIDRSVLRRNLRSILGSSPESGSGISEAPSRRKMSRCDGKSQTPRRFPHPTTPISVIRADRAPTNVSACREELLVGICFEMENGKTV